MTVNLEGATLRRGEINPGIYGEGYIDRRHPHTYLHEAMVGGSARAGALRLSLFGGKGFVPFGSDDPMTRPFVKYPVNHHLAQVMERVMLVGALRAGPAALEFSRFNGDEPENPSDWPNAGRALDSWSVRLTARAPFGLEPSVSRARVESPEFASGQGLDQEKRSASMRLARDRGLLRYALVEWGRTRELERDGRTAFTFSTALAEASLRCHARAAVGARRAERAPRGGSSGRSLSFGAPAPRLQRARTNALGHRDRRGVGGAPRGDAGFRWRRSWRGPGCDRARSSSRARSIHSTFYAARAALDHVGWGAGTGRRDAGALRALRRGARSRELVTTRRCTRRGSGAIPASFTRVSLPFTAPP